MMKINPETLHTKFDIYVLITFLIIILRYKKNNKNIYKIALKRYICFICRIIEARGVRLWTCNIRRNITVTMVNVVFLVTIPNLDVLINDPFYYKILCSSSVNVQRVTTRMEYFISFLHEIVWIRMIWIFGVLTPLSAIFQLYHGDQF